MRVEYRPTRREDLEALAHLTDGSPLPHRIQAITVVIDGLVMGIGGIGHRPDGICVAFVHARPEAKKYPVAFHRAGLRGVELLRAPGARRVFAEADTDNPAAVRWLLRLGFRRSIALSNGLTAFLWEARAK